jgi:hypothetical protein
VETNESDLYEVSFMLGDQKRKMRVKGQSSSDARGSALLYLVNKYDQRVELLSAEIAGPPKPLCEQIVDYAFEEVESQRLDCETEEEAVGLEQKINQMFEERGISDCFDTLQHGKAVHVFPVFYVEPGSIRWNELHHQTDLGWFSKHS